ncbi:hypothetical protein T8T21_18245 (plasmid) [Limimaricola variabilis]|uniref:hypothetical protein n=1 Tax=Limimaricola variabilis TaxID=1492771 RepID=UPI002AC8FEA6|nr:hypothetical protein [Limimaricola variabilis]WPY96444.1 hypothetical protein T8T21_18245 [Limimaricola variabilis]
MSIANVVRLPRRRDLRAVFERCAFETGFLLTVRDRAGIEGLLRRHDTRHSPDPVLLNELLRYKLRISRGAREPVSPEFVVAGCRVVYRIADKEPRAGLLSMCPAPRPGHVLVASLLGATLIGMRHLQAAPLLRDDGRIDTVVVLDTMPPPDTDAA